MNASIGQNFGSSRTSFSQNSGPSIANRGGQRNNAVNPQFSGIRNGLSAREGGNANRFAQNGDQPATIDDLLKMREQDKADQKEEQRSKELAELKQIVMVLAANQNKGEEKKSGGGLLGSLLKPV